MPLLQVMAGGNAQAVAQSAATAIGQAVATATASASTKVTTTGRPHPQSESETHSCFHRASSFLRELCNQLWGTFGSQARCKTAHAGKLTGKSHAIWVVFCYGFWRVTISLHQSDLQEPLDCSFRTAQQVGERVSFTSLLSS